MINVYDSLTSRADNSKHRMDGLSNGWSKVLRAMTSAFLTMCLCLLAISSLQAQSDDIDAPVIAVDEVESGIAGEAQVFSARVSDDKTLISVVLFHRMSGDEAFIAEDMEKIGSTDVFAVTVETDSADNRSIEYYIQAEDAGGNKSLSGFAFDPLVRELRAGVPLAIPTASPRLSNRNRWLLAALGVLAVGVLASQSGGGSGGGGDTPQTVPVNITVNPL